MEVFLELHGATFGEIFFFWLGYSNNYPVSIFILGIKNHICDGFNGFCDSFPFNLYALKFLFNDYGVGTHVKHISVLELGLLQESIL